MSPTLFCKCQYFRLLCFAVDSIFAVCRRKYIVVQGGGHEPVLAEVGRQGDHTLLAVVAREGILFQNVSITATWCELEAGAGKIGELTRVPERRPADLPILTVFWYGW